MHKNTPLPFSGITPKTVHFIGIGGIGMSALAQWFIACREPGRMSQKWAVSGSDISPDETTRSLGKLGVKVRFGHKKGNLPAGRRASPALVIYTQAIRAKNAELMEARRRKIPTLAYPEAAGKLTRFYKTIAVAGAHGKSTTSALVSLILIKAGFDPTVIVGTKLKEFSKRGLSRIHPHTKIWCKGKRRQAQTIKNSGGNFRAGSMRQTTSGKSPYLVLEADEYGGAFLNYSPFLSIVTNIDREHLDFYKNLENVKKSFLAFLKKTKRGGALVLNKDNKILWSLKKQIQKIAAKNKLTVRWYSIRTDSPVLSRLFASIKIPGKHNISNALAALTAGMFAGVSQKTALRAIGEYRGAWRRMEYRGTCRMSHVACRIYDDYAHHPTEIKATLQAFREKFPRQKIVCVFQPHQAERLRILFKDFQSAFTDADLTLILPMYQVAGRDAINRDFTSEKLAKAIQKKYPGKFVFYLGNPKNLKKAITTLFFNTAPQPKNNLRQSASHPRTSAVLVMMGAGDIFRYTDLLLKN
ncbi:MAG: UDP-N-acetylmuramate--L-alanine ligase [Candidatus Liptonbacteria bacterium]|nr:UDP-N-acetylmuramate--L-alanine ligase [Candidatus Liptonbacteria bacterium]